MNKLFLCSLLFSFNSLFAQQKKGAVNDSTDRISYDMEAIRSIAFNTHSHYDKGFAIMFQNAQQFDKIVNRPYWTEHFLMDIILQETIPKVELFDDGNWDNLSKTLKAHYDGSLVDMALALSKIRYYKIRQDWTTYVASSDAFYVKYDKYFSDTDINNAAYFLFQNCNDKKLLRTAAGWMEPIVKRTNQDGVMDTYACVLYKSGKKALAIQWEEKALAASPDTPDYISRIAQMKKGERIW